MVAIDRGLTGYETDTVAIDSLGAARQAVQTLIDSGHEHIAMIAAPGAVAASDRDDDDSRAILGRDRVMGYKSAMHQARLPIAVVEGNYKESGGYRATKVLMSDSPKPTALFSAGGSTTIGVLRALRDEGFSVPQDISVISFDDLPAADLMSPPLTAVQQPTMQLGAKAADLILRRIAEPTASYQHVVLTTQLLIRGSTRGYSP